MMDSDADNATPRLGDFELAKKQAYATKITRVGLGTPAYMAPEAIASAPDKPGDIFSLGVLFLVVLCFQGVEGELVLKFSYLDVDATLAKVDQSHPMLPLLISMLGADPSTRPNAQSVVNALNTAIRVCSICQYTTANPGVECTEHHFLCTDCFNQQVDAITNKGAKDIDYIHCHEPECNSRPFNDHEMVDALSKDTWVGLVSARKKFVEKQERSRLAKLQKDASELAVHRNSLDALVTSHCPHCGGAFIDGDWTACMAVTCDQCQGCFCGFCMFSSRNDLHEHIKTCKKNPRPGYMYMDTHTQGGEYLRERRRLKKEAVTTYLKGLLPGLKDRIVADGVCQELLKSVGYN